MLYDVVIVGGGPAGLSAALALGRSCKRVLLCDTEPRRNAKAERMHNFVSQDGTPPGEFRRQAREQLQQYPKVELRTERVENITGVKDNFQVTLNSGVISARRVLLCTGMIDEMLPIEGFRELWGISIFQCPYCHGWEVRDRLWGYLARNTEMLDFALHLRGWTSSVTVFVSDGLVLPEAFLNRCAIAKVNVHPQPISRLVTKENHLQAIELSNGTSVPCEILFAHPPQKHVALVHSLGLALDDLGLVRVDPMTRETSLPGVYAAGDLTTRMQAAINAAMLGLHAASTINADLTMTSLLNAGPNAMPQE